MCVHKSACSVDASSIHSAPPHWHAKYSYILGGWPDAQVHEFRAQPLLNSPEILQIDFPVKVWPGSGNLVAVVEATDCAMDNQKGRRLTLHAWVRRKTEVGWAARISRRKPTTLQTSLAHVSKSCVFRVVV